jgi:hypothetical protein
MKKKGKSQTEWGEGGRGFIDFHGGPCRHVLIAPRLLALVLIRNHKF